MNDRQSGRITAKPAGMQTLRPPQSAPATGAAWLLGHSRRSIADIAMNCGSVKTRPAGIFQRDGAKILSPDPAILMY